MTGKYRNVGDREKDIQKHIQRQRQRERERQRQRQRQIFQKECVNVYRLKYPEMPDGS